MTDWLDIEKINILTETCDRHGFKFERYTLYNDRLLALKATDNLPAFDKTMPIVTGDVERLLNFLSGWESAHTYLMALGATDPKRNELKSEKYKEKLRAEHEKIGND